MNKSENGKIEIIKTKTPNDEKSFHDPTRFPEKRSPEDLGGLNLSTPMKKAYPFLTSKSVPLVLLGILFVIGLSQQLPKLINTWELNDFMTDIPSVRSKNQYLEYIQNFGDYTFGTRKVVDMSNAVILGISDILLFTFCVLVVYYMNLYSGNELRSFDFSSDGMENLFPYSFTCRDQAKDGATTNVCTSSSSTSP